MVYIVPLLIIGFSFLGIIFIAVRRMRNLPRGAEESLVYPEMPNNDLGNFSNYFSDGIVNFQDKKVENNKLNIEKSANVTVHNQKFSEKKSNGNVLVNTVLKLAGLLFGVNLISSGFNKMLNLRPFLARGGSKIGKGFNLDASVPVAIKVASRTIVDVAPSTGILELAKQIRPKADNVIHKKTVDKKDGVSLEIKEVKKVAEKSTEDVLMPQAEVSDLSSLKDGDSEFDEKYWIGVLKQDPTSSFTYKKLGEIYIARGDFKEARTVLKYAVKLDPEDEEIAKKLDSIKGKRTKLA